MIEPASSTQQLPSVAIIGAGVAGLSLAGFLEHHADVTLFEKARGVGGRMSTRYADQYQFDHGAQYFTARSRAFKTFLKPLLAKGSLKQWQPHVLTLDGTKKPYKRDWFEPHYVAVPKMNCFGKILADGKNARTKIQISDLVKTSDGWFLRDTTDTEHGPFDWVVSAIPSPQAANLVPDIFKGYSEIKGAEMTGCYCLMLGLSEAPKINWQAAVVKNSCIAWVAIDSSKPGRGDACSLVIHSTNEWAEKHIDDDQEIIEEQLFSELEQLLGEALTDVEFKKLHRWRYASTLSAPEEDCLLDPSLQLGVCGDWLIEGHVESAFLSAQALSKKIIPWFRTEEAV